MATWQRRKGKVYVWVYRDGKQRQVPRDFTRHLDGAQDEEVTSWADYYDSETKRTAKALPPMTNEKITKSVDEFCTYLLSRGRDPSTVSHHRSSLLNSVVPYFLSKNIEDVHAWPSASVKMLAALQERGLSHHQITKCNIATSLYWKWLTEEGLVHSTINLRKPVNVKSHTPLQNTLTPEQVWAWLDRPELDPESLAHEPEIKLMCVLGYFFSLRPQEVFALRKKSFVAGKLAKECGKVMAEHGLFPALAVKVTHQITRSGREKLPKAGSGGWVACFDKRAAEYLVGVVNALPEKESRLFPEFLPDRHFDVWKRHGMQNVTMKDLRRASLYHLGHYTSLGIQELANHARHANIETTRLYIRRPDEEVEVPEELDLGA